MSDLSEKPRVRVQAGSSALTIDSFVNFAANLGYGTRNLQSAARYDLSPLSRNHFQLEMMYRGSWLVRQIVDAVAEDMTRAGVDFQTDMDPADEAHLREEWDALQIWQHLQSAIKWARLYGGCLAVLMIDGHDPALPLRVESIGKNQFRGLMVLDRWMVQPSMEDTVRDLGADFGMPRFYDVISDAHSVPTMRVHHSRAIRFEGSDLPYWQKIAENMWGLSVIEPMFDRMIAFDSTTNGVAQLVHKAHLRTLYVERLRELIATGGKAYQAFREQVGLMRLMQSNEGMTLLDSQDKFETQQYGFGGLSEILVQFGQQLAGAAQIPLVRLFGQSPAGMNATGESDIRNYYDMIRSQQEAKLRRPLLKLFDIVHRSVFGIPLPKGFGFAFTSLWQLREGEKAQAASSITQAVLGAFEAGVINSGIVLKELRQSSRATGVWTNITDEDIAEAQANPPMPGELGEGMPGQENALQSLMNGHSLPSQSPDLPKVPQAPQPPKPPRAPLPSKVPLRAKPQRTPDLRSRLLGVLKGDRRSIVDVRGLQCVIETAKGERRVGDGWSQVMAHDYGYISGSSSSEGPREQMDCFIGDAPDAENVYVIHQHNPDGSFDEHKVMLAFPDEDAARRAYFAAFGDGSGPLRLGAIQSMSFPQFKDWMRVWKYGLSPAEAHESH